MTKVFREMIQHGAGGGILLVFAAVLAIVIANTPLAYWYEWFGDIPIVVQIGAFEINKPLLLWVNDGLMALFFFLIGLEVKRELIDGHLSSRDQILLPAFGAIAGLVLPAAIYLAFNGGDSLAASGWAIPAATDIAFALGVYSLFGSSLPASLKLFLLSVAIFDDIAAILIIAIFYSSDLSTYALTVAMVGLCILFAFNRLNLHYRAPYIIVGVVIWAAVLKSGVHATLAGFAAALFIPMSVPDNHGEPMLKAMEHRLQPWVAFLILPLFAFSNAGVSLLGVTASELFNPITIGIALGLFVGKQLGVFGVCWIAIKLGVAKLPAGATWLQVYGVATLCGIGFTMSLFIGSLAFENAAPVYMDNVKIGVLAGSLMSAIVGAAILFRARSVPDPSRCVPANQAAVQQS